MELFDITGLLFKLYLVNLIVSADAAVLKNQFQNLATGQGLYNATDNVVVLNVTNFKSSVYTSSKGWLVEFYNSWCGFCQRYAPTWKAFATDIYPWRDIVVIAAIDCADDDNNPICREYEIMHYPMLKYFSVNAHPPSLGIAIEKAETVDTLRYNLLDRLEKEQQEGRGSSWPNITPYRNYEIGNIWKAVASTVKYFFLIFENTDSHLGAEVILDMHKMSMLQIRRVTSDNELLCETNKVTKFPSLIAFHRNETQKLLPIKVPTREGVSRAIKTYMNSKGENIILTDETETNSYVSTTESSKQPETIENQEASQDHLYQLDLENALRYSISHEIPLSKYMEGEKLEALKSYLSVLIAYFPFRRSGEVLEVINDILEKKDGISGEEFSQLVKSVEEQMSSMYSGPAQWIACKGSREGYRGYPCGLWTLFHTLTVNFALQDKRDLQQNPTTVLRAMHGYIKNFFGCADCSQHFQQMAAANKIFDVQSLDENILWLWRAHNEVNARLSGDSTEDPKHKKIQYPSTEHCPMCRHSNGSWNEERVLEYLKKKYSYTAINHYGSIDKEKVDDSDKLKIRQERLATSKYVTLRKLGWDFTIFDISICVVLYITSAAILILVCIKFAVKRTYRKKTYISLLSKV